MFICKTRKSSATAGESEHCCHFIFHNSSFCFSVRRPAVGSSDWLDNLRATESKVVARSEIATVGCITTMLNVTRVFVTFWRLEECRKKQPAYDWNQQDRGPCDLSNCAHLAVSKPQSRD